MLIGAKYHRIIQPIQERLFYNFDFINMISLTHIDNPVIQYFNAENRLRYNNLAHQNKAHLLHQNRVYDCINPVLESLENHSINPFVINVFNEILLDIGALRYKALTHEVIENALKDVRNRLKNTKLGLSDYRLFLRSQAKFDAYYELISKLNKDQKLVDAFSIQIWRYENDGYLKKQVFLQTLKQLIKKFKSLDVEVHISECCVFINQYDPYVNKPDLEKRIENQSKYYQDILEICADSGVKSFCFWQPFDDYQPVMKAFQKRSDIDYSGVYDVNYNLKFDFKEYSSFSKTI